MSEEEDDGGGATITPYGLYLIAFFHLLGLAAVLYLSTKIPAYRLPVTIYTPLTIYAVIGTIRRWKWAWQLLVFLVSLNLAIAILEFVILFSTDVAGNFSTAELLGMVLNSGLRVLIMPFILTYLLGKGVRAFIKGTT